MWRSRAESEQLGGGIGLRGRRERLATASGERTLPVTLDEVWRVAGDPHHMPRWWPACERMEGVSVDAFTQVFRSKRGRTVRMDFRVVSTEPPRRLVFAQEVADSPFARFLGESVTEIVLEAVGARTRVVISQKHTLRGYSRTGVAIFRRAADRRLGEALEGLERATSG